MLRSERVGSALLVTFDRPRAKNAINRALAAGLCRALRDAEGDSEVCAVVLASSRPEVFLAGGDLKEFRNLGMDAAGAEQVTSLGIELAAIERCAVPVIAAVAGRVLGGGCELLMMCDLLVMEPSASIAFVHARMGLVPAWGGATRLAERVGESRASELLLSARTLSAEEAERWGLVARMAPEGGALETALALAEELSGLGREPLVAMKQSLLAARLARRGDALAIERERFCGSWGSAAHLRALEAFEKGRR